MADICDSTRAGASGTTAHMSLTGPITCLAREEKMMSRELHWSVGNHDEDEEVVEPCDWCGDSNGDDCICYVQLDEEEYRV